MPRPHHHGPSRTLGQRGTYPRELREELPAGTVSEPVVVHGCEPPLSLMVVPGEGAAAVVETTRSPRYYLDRGEAFWEAWPAGEVGEQTPADLLSRETAIRVRALGGPVTWEVLV